MSVTISMWALFGISILATMTGFLFGILAVWHPYPSPRQTAEPVTPPRGRGLPRAGYLILEDPFPADDTIVLDSAWRAQMDAHEREIRQLTAAAEMIYP
jgi:hypothetical protein